MARLIWIALCAQYFEKIGLRPFDAWQCAVACEENREDFDLTPHQGYLEEISCWNE